MAQNDIHEVVRLRYGSIARTAGTPQATRCCGSEAGCGTSSGLYDMTLLQGFPVDVRGISLGCEGTQFTRSNPSC